MVEEVRDNGSAKCVNFFLAQTETALMIGVRSWYGKFVVIVLIIEVF